MSNYRKLIAAAVALVVMAIGPEGFGITTSEVANQIGEFIIMGAGLFAVWYVPNTPSDSTTLRSPALLSIGAAVLALLMLGGCASTLGIDKDRLDTANKQLADKVLFVESLARFATRLVQRGVITPDQGDIAATHLQTSLNALNTAQAAVARNGDPTEAEETIERVDRSLAIVLDLLLAFAPSQTTAIDTYKLGVQSA